MQAAQTEGHWPEWQLPRPTPAPQGSPLQLPWVLPRCLARGWWYPRADNDTRGLFCTNTLVDPIAENFLPFLQLTAGHVLLTATIKPPNDKRDIYAPRSPHSPISSPLHFTPALTSPSPSRFCSWTPPPWFPHGWRSDMHAADSAGPAPLPSQSQEMESTWENIPLTAFLLRLVGKHFLPFLVWKINPCPFTKIIVLLSLIKNAKKRLCFQKLVVVFHVKGQRFSIKTDF